MTNPLVEKFERKLSAAERDLLIRLTRNPVAVAARQDIVHDGEEVHGLTVLMDGIACSQRLMAGGRRAITGYVLPGSFCDLGGLLGGKIGHGVFSLTPCMVVEISATGLAELTSHPGLMRMLLSAALTEKSILREWLAQMGQEMSDRRVAHLVCELRARFEDTGMADGDGFKLPLTQEELGESLGISTVHVNRVLQRLRSDGLIHMLGRVVSLPDIVRLETFAEFTPGYLHLDMAARGAAF